MYHPQNTIITFDLHGVVFKQANWQIVKHIWGTDKKIRMSVHLFNPRFIFDVIKLFWRKTVIEKMIFSIARKYPFFTQKIPLGIRVANAQKPIQATITIIKELKQRGYELHILSNIGQTILQDLIQQAPEVIKLFDASHVAHAGNGYLGKPDPRVFQEYLTKHNQHDKKIIFIDDKKKNIAAAQKHGIVGVHFTSGKKLHKQLCSLGIMQINSSAALPKK